MSEDVRKFLTYPAVIDWLQWAEHPEKLGDIDGPQITLLLIKEYREAYQEAVELIERLETGLLSIRKFDGFVDYPEHEVRHAIAVEMPFECDQALELITKWRGGG